MKLAFVGLLLTFLCGFSAYAQSDEINVIPRPQSIQFDEGSFSLNSATKLVASDDEGRKLAGALNAYLANAFKLRLDVVKKAPKANFIAFLPESRSTSIISQNGAYVIRVTNDSIRTEGLGAGRFYSLQTLTQLLRSAADQKVLVHAQTIVDQPRFRYRGMHLDVARHFQPVDFVKKFIDLMSQYKFNYFHWHLTDD